MSYSPKKTRYRKHHRGRLKGSASRGNLLAFAPYGLQAMEPSWITSRQMEAARRACTRKVRRHGKLWIRFFPDKAVTYRSAETRMGSGKGSPKHWVAVIKPGKILYELAGVQENLARKALELASSKLSIKTRFVQQKNN